MTAHGPAVRWIPVAAMAAAVLLPVAPAAAVTKRADLALKAPKVSASAALPAKPVELSVTVRNAGKANAKASSLRGYLATKPKRGKADLQLLGKIAVKSIKVGKTQKVKGTVMVPATAPTGTYRLILCADDAGKVKESSEKNNCLAIPGTFTVLAPQTEQGVVPGNSSPLPGGLPGPSGDPGPGPGPGSGPDPGPNTPGPNEPGPNNPGPNTPGPTTPNPNDPAPPAPDLPGGAEPVPAAPSPPTARALSPTVPTTVADETSFLYEGTGAVQTGVDPDDIDPARAGVLRGRVLQGDGLPLPGVTVTISARPEFGSTVTRSDGRYDLAVNGGEPLVLRFERPTFLPIDQPVAAPVRDYEPLDDVVMRRYDTKATDVAPGASTAQVAVSSTTSDADGSRRANLVFLPGTNATMTLPDGSTKPLANTMTVRATEYTVGVRGPQSMPGELPANSGYTYAADYTVDEAEEAGATKVSFDKPVVVFTDNFLGFPVGTAVPLGSYDEVKKTWVPEANGRVVKIIAIAGGAAQLDVTGDGTADSGAVLTDLGITAAELQQLAGLYEAGKTLWRSQVTHFSPWDHNWPYGPPDDADPPNPPDPPDPDDPKHPKDPKDPCKDAVGSWVDCDSRGLRERLAVAGTPYTLEYNSDRALARQTLAVDIPVSGASVPASLKSIELTVNLAGRRFAKTYSPAANITERFVWDGKDAYGRPMHRRMPAVGEIAFIYEAVYRTAAQNNDAFGRFGNALTAVRARQEIRITKPLEFSLGSDALPPSGLGGWSLSPHHGLDTVSQAVTLGNGDRQLASVGSVSRLVTQRYTDVNYPDRRILGAPVWQADGSIWYPDVLSLDSTNDRLQTLRIQRDAGDGSPPTTIATFPTLPAGLYYDQAMNMVRAPDGGVWVLPDLGNFARNPNDANDIMGLIGAVVWHVSPAGVISKVTAGSPTEATVPTERFGAAGDGRPASEVVLEQPNYLATGPDGTLYIGELGTYGSPSRVNRVQRIGQDGILRTVYKAGPELYYMEGMAVGDNGRLLFTDIVSGGRQVKELRPDGTLKTVFGGGTGPCCKGGERALEVNYSFYGPATYGSSGELIVNLGVSTARVGVDGRIEIIAGNSPSYQLDTRQSAPAVGTNFQNPTATPMSVSPDGRIAVSTGDSIRTIEPGLPGYSITGYPVPIGDGEATALFNASGRHLKTVDTLTGKPIETFGYDGDGRLTRITDRDGRVTTIERSAAGAPTGIVAPGGERTDLAVNADGNLTSVKRQGVPATTLTYKAGGLLTGETDTTGGTHAFAYDANGILVSDTDPDGITTTVAGSKLPGAGRRSTLTSPLGRTRTYDNTGSENVGWTRKITDAAGAQTTLKVGIDGARTTNLPDGRVVGTKLGADPRFGALLPFLESGSIKQPSGLELARNNERIAALTTPTELFSLATQEDRFKSPYTYASQTYNAAANTIRTRDATNLERTNTLDPRNRIVKSTSNGVGAVDLTYDTRGRLTKRQQGSSSGTYAYDTRDRLTSITDALGNKTEYTTDTAGRTSSVKVPGGQTYSYGYDGLGRPTSLTLPSGAKHELGYTAAGREKTVVPPGSGTGYVSTRDADGDLKDRTLPGGRKVTMSRDASSGRLTGQSYPEAAIGLSYVGPDGRVASISRDPVAAGATSTTAFTYDGDLVRSIDVSGPSTGKYEYTFGQVTGQIFNPTQVKLTVGADSRTITTAYDNEGRVTGADGFSFVRNGPLQAVSAITGGPLSVSQSWDTQTRISARTDTVNGASAYGMALTRDDAGKITRKVETGEGGTHTYDYVYDANGRVTQVKRDTVEIEAYTYDVDGHRLSRKAAGTTKAATYVTAASAIDAFGGTDYTVDADGQLTKRGSDSFTWSARGELLTAAVAGGTTTYAYDGFGRRVAMTVGAQTTRYLYGNTRQELQVTAIVEPDGTFTTLNYTEQGVLFSFLRGATRYYVSADAVGSPRVVTNASGTVVKAVTYSAYGETLTDSAPGFALPLGYAGGVPDPSTGFVHMGVRDYDPATGRFTSRDPLGLQGGDANLYGYAGGDPVQLSDPLGLTSAGATLCEGICVGFKWAVTKDGLSVCAETGFGAGNDFAFNPIGGLDDNKAYLKASLEASLGPFAGYELSDELSSDGHCRKNKVGHQICVVGACAEKGEGFKFNPEKMADIFSKGLKLGVEGKAVGGVCQNVTW